MRANWTSEVGMGWKGAFLCLFLSVAAMTAPAWAQTFVSQVEADRAVCGWLADRQQSGTALPAKAGYSFAPAARTFANVAENRTAQDHAATGEVAGPYGGEITDIAVDPVNVSVVYAATLGGGVFKSADGGESWISANVGIDYRYVDELEIPSRPAAEEGDGHYKRGRKAARSGGQDRPVAATAAVILTVDAPPVGGDISPAGDSDAYQFTVASAGYYRVETWLGTLPDSYMKLYGPDDPAALLESDDDGGVGLASMIYRQLSPGVYYVAVTAYASTQAGTYTVGVSTAGQPGSVSGRVTDASGNGIGGISVEVCDVLRGNWVGSNTDPTGNYAVLGLPGGGYKVRFNNNGLYYVSEYYNGRATFDAADQVAVVVGSTTPNIDAQLASGGGISGRVTDSAGVGIHDIFVEVYNSSNQAVKYAWTGTTGYYVVVGLSADSYKVWFSNNGLPYVSEWYDDRGGFAEADQVAVVAGSTTPNIDAQLAQQPTAGFPDFNKDGKTDILWRSGATGELYAWYMDGAAKLDGASLGFVPDQGWRVAGAADFDSDGDADILWRNYATGENYVWYMDGAAQAGGEALETVADAAWRIAGVGDFNSDGKPDILWRNPSTGDNYAWFMDGALHEGGEALEAVADAAWKIAGVGDFNSDGKPDLLWRNASTGANFAWFMNGTLHEGGAEVEAVADLSWFIAWVGDYDGDGDADVLWRNTATGDNVLWTMSGVARELATYLDAEPDQAWRMWDAAAAAAPPPPSGVPSDFDGDGKADVLWRNATTGDLYVWTMDGVVRKGAGAPVGAVADARWKVAGMADFDADGNTDLLWRNYGTGENYVWYMNGLVQSGGEAVEAVGDPNWLVAGTGDFNSDGKPDILWRNYATGENYVWYMDGAAKAGSAPLDAVGDAAWKIAGAADFTGDGKPDVLWRNTSSGQVYIWTMDGVAHVGGSDLGVVPLEWEIRWTADYSGDGNPDILWRNTATGENHAWYIVGAAQVGGAPVEAVGDLAWEIMPQIYPAAGGWKAGDLYGVDAVVGNLRYVPSTVEAGARLPRGLAGGFVQGSPADEPCRSSSETQFTHTLTKSLAVMETEVTRQMWADLKVARPTLPADPTSTAYGAGMTNPVQSVTWYEAVLFANLLSLQRGLVPCYYADAGFTMPITAANYTAGPFYCNWNAGGYRLPSEAEWEYFCRAGTTNPFWIAEPNYTSANCGSASTLGMYPSLETAAWFVANNTPYGTKPVGTKASNPWNLKDVHGNVVEWCWDWYGTYPAGSATDYRGASTGSHRVLRGGGWSGYAQYCRSAVRYDGIPGSRSIYGGFRLARSLP